MGICKMSIQQAKIIIQEYDLQMDEQSIEIVLELINKYGSAKNVLLEGLKPKYKYLKKLSKLLAMLDEKQEFDKEAEEISTLMHNIHKVVLQDSEAKGEDFMTLLAKLDIRKTFHPNDMQIWVMEYLGGRKFIANINYEEPNYLIRKILNAIEKYKTISNSENLALIQNKTIQAAKPKKIP